MEKELKEKEVKKANEKELDFDDLEQVAGGVNPFGKYERVPNQKYDDSIKEKV